jgi:hypothetical protein
MVVVKNAVAMVDLGVLDILGDSSAMAVSTAVADLLGVLVDSSEALDCRGDFCRSRFCCSGGCLGDDGLCQVAGLHKGIC